MRRVVCEVRCETKKEGQRVGREVDTDCHGRIRGERGDGRQQRVYNTLRTLII